MISRAPSDESSSRARPSPALTSASCSAAVTSMAAHANIDRDTHVHMHGALIHKYSLWFWVLVVFSVAETFASTEHPGPANTVGSCQLCTRLLSTIQLCHHQLTSKHLSECDGRGALRRQCVHAIFLLILPVCDVMTAHQEHNEECAALRQSASKPSETSMHRLGAIRYIK